MQLQEFHRWTPPVWGQAPLAEWRERLQAVCGRFNPHGNDGIELVTDGVTTTDAAGYELVQVATDVNQVRRSREDVRRDYSEHFFLLLQLEGSCGVEQAGRQHVISPGDCILVDSALPMTFYFNGAFSNHLSVHLPRWQLLEQKPDEFIVSRRLAREDPMSTMLRALVAKMLQTSATNRRAEEMRRLLLQATRQAFAADGPDDPFFGDRSCGRLELAQMLVDRHLTEECLTPQWLAKRLGVSLRTLQDDFSTLGSPMTSYIRDRRLQFARDRLARRNKTGDGGTIAEVAFSSGFNDISYFNRSFKKAFDCSPKDVGRG